MTRPSRPGKLVAKESLATWRSPAAKTFRLLSLDAAQAKFQLENVGDKAVHILDVQTTCGCTTPKIDPMIIAPGKLSDVEIRATPLQIGEKHVDITITTDSPLTPTVVLKLHIIGSRSAPFMSEARGDLNYSGDAASGETRPIFADTVETKGSKPVPPIVKNDLTFLDISPAKLEDEGFSSGPDTVHKRYVFEAKLRSPQISGNEYGQIQIIDPWDSEHISNIHVHYETTPLMRVTPLRAVLTVGKLPVDEVLSAKFVVTVKEAISDFVVDLEDEGKSPLLLSKLTSSEDQKRFVFSVHVNDAKSAIGI